MSDVPVSAELTSAELSAWRGLLRVHAELVRRLDAELEAAHGLPLNCYEVLITLGTAHDRRLRMAELADQALLSRSGMTRLVDRLERDGLLERIPCEEDARGCFACLTDEGARILAAARPTHLDGVRRIFLSALAPGELEGLGTVWERILSPRQA